jgi:hypothetical protein
MPANKVFARDARALTGSPPDITHILVPDEYKLNSSLYYGIHYTDGNTYWAFNVEHRDFQYFPDALSLEEHFHTNDNWLVLDSQGRIVQDIGTYKNIAFAAEAARMASSPQWQPDQLRQKSSDISMAVAVSQVMDFLQLIGNTAGSGIVGLLTGGASEVKKLAFKTALKKVFKELLLAAVDEYKNSLFKDPVTAYKNVLRLKASSGAAMLTSAANMNVILKSGDTEDYSRLINFYNSAREGHAIGWGHLLGLSQYYKGGISEYLTNVITSSLGIDEFLDDIVNLLGLDSTLQDSINVIMTHYGELTAEKIGIENGAEKARQAFSNTHALFLETRLDKDSFEVRDTLMLRIYVKDEKAAPIGAASVTYTIKNNWGVIKKQGTCQPTGSTGEYADTFNAGALGAPGNYEIEAIASLSNYRDGKTSRTFSVYRGGNLQAVPGSLNISLPLSSTYYGSIDINNNGAQQTSVTASKTGTIKDWISITGPSFIVAVGDTYKFNFEINVPQTANSGTGALIFSYDSGQLQIPVQITIVQRGDNLGNAFIDGSFHPDTPDASHGATLILKYPNRILTDTNSESARYVDSFWLDTGKADALIRLQCYSRCSKIFETGPSQHYFSFYINGTQVWKLYKETIQEWNDVIHLAKPGTNEFKYQIYNFTHGANEIKYNVENFWFQAFFSKQAWGYNYPVDSSTLTTWKNGWDYAKIEATVKSVQNPGWIYGFVNGKNIGYTMVDASRVGQKIAFYIGYLDRDTLKTENRLNIKGCYFKSTSPGWDNHPIAELENIRFDVLYYTGLPVLEVKKIVEKSPILVGESTKVEISLKNTGSNKAYYIKFTDSIPAGLLLENGKLDASLALRPGEIFTLSYYIKAQNEGTYTLPRLTVSYKDPAQKIYYSYSDSPQLKVSQPISFTLNAKTDKTEYAQGETITLDVTVGSNVPAEVPNTTVYYEVLDGEDVLHSSSGKVDLNGKYKDSFKSPLSPKDYKIKVKLYKVDHLYAEQLLAFRVVDKTPPTKPVFYSPLNDVTIPGSKPHFDWTDCFDAGSGLKEYILEVDDNDTFSSPVIKKALNDSQYLTTEGLPDNKYYARVLAYDNANNFSVSDRVTFKIDTVPPGNVTGFAAAGKGDYIALSWQNPGDPDFKGVKVLRKTDGFPADISDGIEIYMGQGTSFSDTAVEPEKTYYYTAFAFDEAPNFSAAVPSAQGKAATLVPPGVLQVTISPQEAIAAGGQWKMTLETLWHNSGDTVSYPPGDYTLTFKTLPQWKKPPDKLIKIISGQTLNETGTYEWIIVPLLAPNLESPANGAVNQSRSLDVRWQDTNSTPQEQSYRVRIKKESGNYIYYTATQNAASYPLSGLAANTLYYWNVLAAGDGIKTQDSPWANSGNDWSFKTECTLPYAKTLEATDITLYSAVLNGIANPKGTSSFAFFQYGTDGNLDSRTPSKSIGSGNSNTGISEQVTGLQPGTAYMFRLAVQSSCGTIYGEVMYFKTLDIPVLNAPVFISPLNGASDQPITLNVQWQDTNTTPQEQGYKVRIKQEGGSYTYYNAAQNAVSFEIPDLSYDTAYYWNVQAIGNGTDTQDSPWADSGMDRLFTTTSPPIIDNIQVLSPNGGEKLTGGIPFLITWEIAGKVVQVEIEYSADNGQKWNVIAACPAEQKSYSWTVPAVNSDQCLVRISDAADNIPSDTSNAVFTIHTIPPNLSLSRKHFNFGAAAAGTVTPPQTFTIDNKGGGTLNWALTDNAAWLNVTPVSGLNSGIVTVSVNPAGLSQGTYTGIITVSAPEAVNSPQAVTVILKVYGAGKTAIPFGDFATPQDGSTVMSSIPVTGWVLDDIQVTGVKIYRKQNMDSIYIGDAVFVEGARPDVEIAYPVYPLNYRAGWGYMLLTNFLPNGGNGTFTLEVTATDAEGHSVTLGTKTITCDNAHAVKPFGAIDTPTQGGTASGRRFINWGWALTPQPNKIPTDGSTIHVFVDGKPIGRPTYNIYRIDIATLFPTYANSGGAVGYFYLNTTAFENGLHTIQWSAVDNAGNIDGIGSRYFTIYNETRPAARIAQRDLYPVTPAPALARPAEKTRQPGMTGEPLSLPPDTSTPVKVKKGYSPGKGYQTVYPDKKGNITVEIKELEWLEIQLNADAVRSTSSYTVYAGYLKAGDQLMRLPVGSSLDMEKGIFYWQPGPGFVGDYEFVFIGEMKKEKEKGPGKIKRRHIVIRIDPKFVVPGKKVKEVKRDQRQFE